MCKSFFKMLRFAILLLVLVSISASFSQNWLKQWRQKPVILIDGVKEPLQNSLSYDRVYYSNANISSDFKSTTKFRATGMTHLYYLTEKFVEFLSIDQVLPPGFLNVSSNQKEMENIVNADMADQVSFLMKHYGIIMLVILLAVLFIITVPAAGLAFCCCRCAGRCGVRSEPFDKRYDPCRRYVYGSVLTIVTILILFGVVCAFTTNEFLEEGVTTLPHHIRVSLNDANLYINNTKEEVNTLFIVNFGELETTLSHILDASGKIVLNQLGQVSKATALLNLTTIIDGLSVIQTDLQNVDMLTRTLQNNALQLAQGLKDNRETLLKKMNQCSGELACQDFLRRFNIKDVSLEANFLLLPDVTAALKNLSEIMASDIKHQVGVGRQQYESVQSNIQDAVKDYIPPIKKRIRRAGESVSKIAERINFILDRISEAISNYTNDPIEDGKVYINKFSPYRYYVCIGISAVLGLVLISLTVGLTCGFCGSRPNSGNYQDECCNKGTGSRYLMLAVWVMFLSASFLMMVVLVYFIAGISTEKVICQTLRSPQESPLFSLLDYYVDINKYYEMNAKEKNARKSKVHLKDIVRSCHKNHSLYEVLQLEDYVVVTDVMNYTQSFDIDSRINEMVSNIKLDQEINILSPTARKLLEELAQSSLNDIDFPAYTHVLDEKITSIDLLQIAAGVNETAYALPPHLSDVKLSLLNQALYLKTHQEHLVSTMVEYSKRLESTALQLQQHLKFNHTSLRKAVDHLLSDVQEAQKYIKLEGRAMVEKFAYEFGTNFSYHIRDYFNKVVLRVRYDVGRCSPISQAYNATLVAGCSRILYPFNGFWMSVGATVLLFVPAIILAVLLANLYQKCDSYPGPLVEAEYLYDIYGADHIPLNKPQWEVQANGSSSASTAVVQPEFKETLTAPTSSSGSPSYGNSEYERPPPYYYPKRLAAMQVSSSD